MEKLKYFLLLALTTGIPLSYSIDGLTFCKKMSSEIFDSCLSLGLEVKGSSNLCTTVAKVVADYEILNPNTEEDKLKYSFIKSMCYVICTGSISVKKYKIERDSRNFVFRKCINFVRQIP